MSKAIDALDDLLAVTREFLSEGVSRSGLDRCLRRHGVGNLNAFRPAAPKEPHQAFRSYQPGYLHMDVMRMLRVLVTTNYELSRAPSEA